MMKNILKNRIVMSALILLGLILLLLIIWLKNNSINPMPSHLIDGFYIVDNEPANLVLASWGATPIDLASLSDLPSGSRIIIDGRSDQMDDQQLKAIASQHIVFIINLESTVNLARDLLGLQSYEILINDAANIRQLIKINQDQTGQLTLTVIGYLDPEISGYQDLVDALLQLG